MGGLTALLLADRDPTRIASFTDIEGNLAPEDCFLSRPVVTHPHDDEDTFLARFAERAGGSGHYSSALYAASLPHKVRAGAVKSIFESMVELSDNAGLLDRFLGLPIPRMFLYGEQNSALTYLPALAEGGVELAPISRSAHFPMYANPPRMWARIAEHVARAESRTENRTENRTVRAVTKDG
jgi:pimeloyl-ACP methyl ester carboxylesterase